MSKGDTPRPVNAAKYRENWERIFGVLGSLFHEERPEPPTAEDIASVKEANDRWLSRG